MPFARPDLAPIIASGPDRLFGSVVPARPWSTGVQEAGNGHGAHPDVAGLAPLSAGVFDLRLTTALSLFTGRPTCPIPPRS